MNSISVKNVSKRFKNTLALDNISFNIEHGKIHGLLGRNGAGKSTLINIISNRIFADSGDITIDDETVVENNKMHDKIYCMSESDYYPNYKVINIFKWTNEFYDCFDFDKALNISKQFGLNVNKKLKNLSTGYNSIFKLVIALSLNTPYVIFDEPVLGLDANHRELFYKLLIEDYEKNGRTVIIATHLIEEVANLIEDVIIIDKGKLLLQSSIEDLMMEGYTVSGTKQDVEKYCIDENVIGYDEIAGMKIAYVMGYIKDDKLNDRLHISSINLQKLFVKLTDNGGV